MFFNNKFSFLAFILFLFLLFPTFSMSITIEEEIKKSNTLIERLRNIDPNTADAKTLAMEIMHNPQCKSVLKTDPELGKIFHDLIYGANATKDKFGGLANTILEKAKVNLLGKYPDKLTKLFVAIRNDSSWINKTPPMDLDFGILGQEETVLTELKKIGVSVDAFHKDIKTAFDDSFIEVGKELGLSSTNPEQAFITGTTVFYAEAYKDAGVIDGAAPLERWISQTGDVSKFKINELKKKVIAGLISKESASKEAARGTLKDLDKLEKTFAQIDSINKTPALSKINKEFIEMLKELRDADNAQAILIAIDKIEEMQGKDNLFKSCNDLIDNMEAAWKLASLNDTTTSLLKKLFKAALQPKDIDTAIKAMESRNFENLPTSAKNLRKKIFNLAATKRISLSSIGSSEQLFEKLKIPLGLDNLSNDSKQILFELLENIEEVNDPKILKKALGDYLGETLIKLKKSLPDEFKISLGKRLVSRIPLKNLDGKWTSLQLGDGGLGVEGFIGIAMTYKDIDGIMKKKNLSPEDESRQLQNAVVSNMPIIGDFIQGFNKYLTFEYEGGKGADLAEGGAYLVLGIAACVPGGQTVALVTGLGIASTKIGVIAWDAYWDRRLIEAWVKSGIWDKENGILLGLKDISDNKIDINYESLVNNFNKKYKYDYYDMTIRDSILEYTRTRLLERNEEIKIFEKALLHLYPEANLAQAITEPRERGEGLIRGAIRNAGDGGNIDRNIALGIYRKYKDAVDKQSKNAIEYLKSQAEKEYQARHHVGEALETFINLDALGERLGLPLRKRVHSTFLGYTNMIKKMGSSPFILESLPRRKVQMAERYYIGYLKIESQLKQIKEMFKMVDIPMPRHKMTGYLEIDEPRMDDLKTTYMISAIIPARQEVERLYYEETGDDTYKFNLKNADYCQLELFKKLGGILVKKVDTEDRRLLVEQWRGKLSAAGTSRDKAIQDLERAQKDENVDINYNPLSWFFSEKSWGKEKYISVPTLKALYHLGDAYESAYAWTNVRIEGTQVYEEALETLMERAEKLEEEYLKEKESGTTHLSECLSNLPKINITFSGEKPRVSVTAEVIEGKIPEGSNWKWFVEGKISLIESHEDTAILHADGNGIVTVKLINEEQILAQVSESLKFSTIKDPSMEDNDTAKEKSLKEMQIQEENTEKNAVSETSKDENSDTGTSDQEPNSIEKEIEDESKLDDPDKNLIVHGSGGSISGMYPSKSFNGMQISYDVAGCSFPKMKDIHDFTTSRHYEGRLGDGTLTLSGTASVGSPWTPDVSLSVSVRGGDKPVDRTFHFRGPGSESFELSVPILKDALSGGFRIYMGSSYGNGQFRDLIVSGSCTHDGPEGESPKGTEDLVVILRELKKEVQIGEEKDLVAEISGGRIPYTYAWSGAEGKEQKALFQSNVSGENTVSLSVTDIDGNTAQDSIKVMVQSPEFEVVGLPKKPLYASKAKLNVRIKNGGKSSFKPIWQSSEPGIEFDPPEGMSTTVTFGRVKKISIWVQVPQPEGGKTLESKQVHTEVVGPKFTLKLDTEEPYIGKEVRANITSSTKLPEDTIRWIWSSPQSSNRMEYNDPASEIGFMLKDIKPLKLEAEARVPHWGDVIGTVKGEIQAQEYEVKVNVLGPLGPKPMIWKEGKGLVEVDKEIAVHQNIRLEAKISPQPKDTDLRYEWKLNEGSHFAGGSTGSEVMVNRSQTGTAVATVTLKDKDDNVLGTGSGTFSVTISQQQIDTGKQNDEDQKKAQALLEEGRELWKQGKLQEAIDKVENAQNLVPKDKKIIDTLKAMQKQKKDLDSKLKESEGLIKEAKLKEAEKMLSSAALINDKYSRYKEMLQQLADAKKKFEDEKKKVAKLLNDAKVLEKVGKLDEADKLLEDGSKQVSDNTQLTKELKEVQEQQDDAVNKMTEGQDQWEKGMIDEAIITLTEAAKIDPSNKDVSKILKSMQLQKKTIDGLLKKSSDLIVENKFSDAETSLKKASYINDKYIQYKDVLQELADAKKKVEDEKKKIAKLLKDAKALEKAGKLDEADKLLEDGSKQVSDNTQLTKALKTVQEQQADAVNKMTEGQDQWEKGMLEKAVSTLNEALKIDPSNKQIENVLKDIQDQKTIMDDTLITADKLIEQQKFDEANSVLKKAQDISGNYPPYVEILEKLDLAKKEAEQIIKPSTQDIDYALGFAGKWKSDYGLMEFKVDGLGVTGNYTHDKGRIEAHLSEDSKTMKGTWTEYPSYQGSNDSGKMYFKLSSDGKKIEGLWSFGDAVPNQSWNATRILDTESKTPVSGQSKEISSQGVTNNTSKSDSTLPIQTSTSAVKNSIGGYWKLVNIVGDLGRECTLKEWSNSYYRHTISGNEGDVTMTKMLRKSNQTFFSARVTWQRPPEIIYPGKVIDFPLSIQKLNDTKKYSSSMSISIDTHDMKCGFARAGGRIGSLILRSGDPTTSKSKTMHWKVKEPFKKEADEKLTIRVCYSGVQICGDKDKRGWKYYYAWVPEGTSEPSSIDKHPINTISSSIDKKKDTPSSTKISSDIKQETQNYPSSTASVSSKGIGGYWKMADTIIYVNPRINNHKCYETSLKLLDGKFSYSKAQPRCTKPYRPRYTVNGSWTTPPSVLIPAQKYPMKISMQGNLQDWGRGYLGIVMDDFHTKCGGATRSNKKLTDSIDVAYNKQHVNQSNDDYKAPDYGYASSKKTKKFQIKASTRDGCVRYIYEWMSADVPDNTEGKDGIVNIDKTIIKPEAAADLNIKSVVDGTENLTEVKTKTSTTYAPNTKGDVFSGGHWAGASGKSDWLQKDFTSPQLVTGVSISRASTDITTKGFRLILKLQKENGEWVTIDELHDTNINRTALSGAAVGKSIPFYRKTISPAIKATAFRLEFYGHGWFDATDIRIMIMNSTEAEELKKFEDQKEKSIDRFMGTLSGSWSGKGTGSLKDWRTKGNFVMNISKKGKISGHYSGDDHGKLNGSISG